MVHQAATNALAPPAGSSLQEQGQWQVSSEGGREPRWAPGTGALHFVEGRGPSTRWLTEVTIDSSQDPPIEHKARLFDLEPYLSQGNRDVSYDVDTDGRRFLVAREVPGSTGTGVRMVLVQNWKSGLDR